jgi:hypothetical protein
MTIKPISECPNPLDGIYNPPDALKFGCGYRIDPGQPELAEGMTRIAAVFVDDDGERGKWEVTDRPTADITAEQYAARCADFQPLIPHAYMFRALMRQYFGDNAETNRAITRQVVEGYFLTTPNLTVQGVQHGMTIKGLFEELSAWNGTDETWSLFDNYGSLIP